MDVVYDERIYDGLSNTATPKYYGQFRDAVLRGDIPVCETIELEMNRIDKLIKNPGVYYDAIKVEGWIKFCETELTLTDGSPLHLLDTFLLSLPLLPGVGHGSVLGGVLDAYCLVL